MRRKPGINEQRLSASFRVCTDNGMFHLRKPFVYGRQQFHRPVGGRRYCSLQRHWKLRKIRAQNRELQLTPKERVAFYRSGHCSRHTCTTTTCRHQTPELQQPGVNFASCPVLFAENWHKNRMLRILAVERGPFAVAGKRWKCELGRGGVACSAFIGSPIAIVI